MTTHHMVDIFIPRIGLKRAEMHMANDLSSLIIEYEGPEGQRLVLGTYIRITGALL